MPTTISDAAKQSGVSAKMIRYYESIKLLPAVDRTEGNYRAYAERDIQSLRFIRRARDLGYSIADIERLLSLWRNKIRSSADVKRLALDHAASLRDKITEIEAMLRAVQHLADHCRGDHRPDCPIMDDLAEGPTTSTQDPDSRAPRGGRSRNA
ncbi:MAG: Cu(I)-responsive transcriptional regulator, partial [Acidocella sp.]|nr:Cu(I)-responsive transcriptional regulator [Acidocella sp.]